MGIPLYFRTIAELYPEIIINLELLEKVNGLFLDLNCAIHPCCRKITNEDYKAHKKSQFENRMFNEILNYIDKLVVMSNPKLVYLAIDGVAPCSKMNQQRLRRYKTILEREETNKIKDRCNETYNKDFWDTNAISPGTEFMEKLSSKINNHINTNDIYKNKKVIFSNSNVPGEGEHKIFNYIKSNNLSGNNIVYGLDADLIMLSIASKKNNIYLLRESVAFGKVDLDKFLYLDIDRLKGAIGNEMREKYIVFSKLSVDSYEIVESFIYDYVFMCYFLGNDFLPHLPSVSLSNDGLDQILDVYIETYYILKDNLVNISNLKINNTFLKHFLTKLKEFEYDNLKTLSKKRDKFSLKYKKYDNDLDKYMDLHNYYPMLNREQEKKINMNYKGWKPRYYDICFGINSMSEIDDVCFNYFEGLKWTLEYYFKDCTSWNWLYKYNHGPLLDDLSHYLSKFKDINKINIPKGTPNTPIIQLLSILPPKSNHLIPRNCRQLTTSIDSPIIDMYPLRYQLDLVYKKYYWQCVPILPLVDYSRIKESLKGIRMTKEEKNRFIKQEPIIKDIKTQIKVI
jgi:5'-3' exoribonuclease 2